VSRSSLGAGRLDAANRNVGFLLHMLLEHELVIHFVDVIARQHQEVFRVETFDNVEVLIDRVRGAVIPELFLLPRPLSYSGSANTGGARNPIEMRSISIRYPQWRVK